jgi:hypothetical protein
VKVASSSVTAIEVLEELSISRVLLEYKLEGLEAEAVTLNAGSKPFTAVIHGPVRESTFLFRF